MEIEFNREKAFKRLLLGDVNGFFWWSIVFTGFYFLIRYFSIQEDVKFSILWLIGALAVVILFSLWGIFKSYRVANTRVYQFEADRHTSTQTIITKSRTQARTQVVNDISIDQGLMDKIFGFYTLTVNYGFGDEGYNFSYDFLTEKQALELEDKIRSTNKVVKIE
jgi:membrane protein YdbS with pleckstrin-like domain